MRKHLDLLVHNAIAAIVLLVVGPGLVSGNWLLQCSTCVDQALFSDEGLKDNIKDADTSVLVAQIKQIRLREFDHREDEFYNKFFSKRQLGIVTQELQSVMPSAVAQLPERRWTNAKGVSNMTKNVHMVRESHLLMVALGTAQHLAKRADYWDRTIDKLDKDMEAVVQEQHDNRRKREEMLDQIVRTVAKVEVLQHTLAKTEDGFVRLDQDVQTFKLQQEEAYVKVRQALEAQENRTTAQNTVIEEFKAQFRAAVERAARADLVEKRKKAEASLEVTLVKRSIEKMRWEQEQNSITLRSEEKRKSDEHNEKLHEARVAHELAEKKIADLELMQKQEESNIRQEDAKREGEKELLMLRLKSDERRSEMGLQEAIERAKVEQEALIRAARDNEDVNIRAMRAEQQEKRQQTLAAIKATAEIAKSWIASVYGSPQHLLLAIGSIIFCLGGVHLAREMAILLREQLNKRLGRPSLVRSTNRRGMLQQLWRGLLRLLRLRAPHGAEFSDVVLHPKLHQQVMRLAEATRSAKQRGMPLQHALFYGPPGTGKTMVAQRFAEYSGLEYAIMSGGDVAPLEEQAVTELHKLFKWVHQSRRGVLLFIDEADAFLCSRKGGGMSETLRNALTTMLYHTGTQSSQFMLVIATNRPGDLDTAVLDRLDEAIEFGLPDASARKTMIHLYFNMYIAKPLKFPEIKVEDASDEKSRQKPKGNGKVLEPGSGIPPQEVVNEETLAEVAKRLQGFSGREIAKLFTSLQTHVLYEASQSGKKGKAKTSGFSITRSLVYDVVDQRVAQHGRTQDFQVSGYNYETSGTPDGFGRPRKIPDIPALIISQPAA